MRDKKEKKKARRKHGRCWAEKHKNCPGWGKLRRESGMTVYLCSCKCHEGKTEKIKEFATRWEVWQKEKKR